MKARSVTVFGSLALTLLLAAGANAYDPKNAPVSAHETPQELVGVGITEKLGDSVDLSLEFTDQNGQTVTLGSLLGKQKPVLFTIIYYNCPSLCNYHLNGLTAALKNLDWTIGDKFELVALSMNHNETPELAKAKLDSYVQEYGRSPSAAGWHFLTGSEENIKKIADQVGFGFKWIESTKEFSHASAAQVLTPDGKISRYLHGIEFNPQTIRLSLLEASDGKIGTLMDQFVLYCFQFDPTKNKYTLYAYRVMQAGGALIVLVLAIFLIPFWIREKNRLAKAH